MNEQLQVVITGKDGVSRIFQEIGTSAQDVGRKVEEAGRQGEQGFRRVGESAEDARLNIDDLGGALTAFGSALVYGSRLAMDQERQILGLRKAYGDAADEMIRFAEELDSVTIFSDDDIRAGERFFATLVNNYDMSIAQVQELMRLTADLAAAAGVSFEDASNRVTAALRGEAEAAEWLSLTMNQAAIDVDNVTLSMSNAEAAQFRYNAFLEQSAVYQGTANEMMETSAGTLAEWRDRIDDAAAGLGNFLGPIPAMVSGLGMASLGLTTMIGTAGRALGTLRSSTIAMNALGLAFNPVTLGLGAAVVGGGLLYEAFTRAGEATRALDSELGSLADTIEQLKLSGEAGVATEAQVLLSEIEAITGALRDGRLDVVNEYFGTSFENMTQLLSSAVYDDLQRVMDMSDEFAAHINQTMSTLTAEQQQIYLAHVNAMMDGAVTTMDDSNLDDVMDEIMLTPASEIPGVMDTASASVSNFATELDRLRGIAGPEGTSGEISELNSSINRIDAAVKDGTLSVADLDAYMASLDQRMASGSMTWAQYQEAVENVDDALLGSDRSARDMSDALERLAGNATTATESIAAAGAAAGLFTSEVAAAAEAADAASDAMGASFGEATVTRIEEIIDRTRELATAMLELSNNADYISQVNLTGLGTDATMAAEGLNDAAGALEQTFRVVVGNTNAIGSQVEGIQSWADELINVAGEYGKIDDLLAAGLITLEQYNAAQAAYNEIASSNADIQNYILEIQTNQAPLIAQQTAALEDQLEVIANMTDAQEQLAALGWMDDGMQGRVQQFVEMGNQLAALGDEGEAAMQQIVDGIAATDPVLTAMLEDLGLIEQQANGDYTINMDAVGAMDSTERLIASIDALTLAMGGVPPLDIEVSGWESLELVTQDIHDLAAQGAEGIMIDIATRLKPPGEGAPGAPSSDWWGGSNWWEPEPVDVPVNVQLPETVPPLLVPTEVEEPEIPVVFWEPVPVDADTGPAAASLNAFEPDPISVDVILNVATDWGGDVLGAAQEAAGALGDGQTATVTIEAIDNATAVIQDVGSSLAGLDSRSATVLIWGDEDEAMASIGAVGHNLATLNGATASVNVVGDNADAMAAIGEVQAFDGDVLARSYVDIVTRYSSIGSPTRMAGGIIDEYASGGYVSARLGEAGGEMLHLAGGGYAYAPHDGLYMTPLGSYVSPAPSSPNGFGGFTVNFTGNFYGSNRQELDAWAEESLIPSFGDIVEEWFDGLVAP